uniref:Metallothionein n=1 Tax=Ascaris lumbricoides TaxID=6252 RepID=A0A9J2QB87_ASCLU
MQSSINIIRAFLTIVRPSEMISIGCAEGKECTCKDCPDKKSCHKGESQCCCESTEKTAESEKAKECSKCASK